MNPVTADLLRTLPLPLHQQGDNKEGRGQVLIVGGCLAVPGALLLSGEGALRAGAGKLQIATCRSVAPHLGVAMPEAMVIGLPETGNGCLAAEAGEHLTKPASRADAILIGPGVMDAKATVPLVTELLKAGQQAGFVIDAGAIEAFGECGARPESGEVVITPHAGEMAKLLGVSREAVVADPLRHAEEAAAKLGCVVVMKGGTTHVVEPGGAVWLFEGGTVALGTSGSGDVLAGLIAGLLARGATASLAAIWGVYLHAEAGNRLTRRAGGIGLLARELPGEIPSIMAGLCPP